MNMRRSHDVDEVFGTGPKTAPKSALGTLDIVENAQLSTGAPPGT
jgi:hypothetical protein